MKALLVLEDGTTVESNGFGAKKTVFGELVFNTNMTGYQEALTDPSYKGQILMMTYPLIGNYGVNKDDFESNKIQPEGFVVREECDFPSHRKQNRTLSDFLREYDVPGIAEVDTRALTIKIRKHGTVKAALATYDDEIDVEALKKKVNKMPHPTTQNLVDLVSCKKTINHKGEGKCKIVLVDCGVKSNILRFLLKYSDVIQVPYNISAEEVNKINPDGILISNGPGDPAHPEIKATTVKMLKDVSGDFPIMGICLGHQILSMVFGAETFKLKFGHRGGNQPVKDVESKRVYITSQNHGFAVKPTPIKELTFTHFNVNDGTVEGMKHPSLPIFSVQYHPEASPGPQDSHQLFHEFMDILKRKGRGG
ncbi:MAG: glutamine-hydrolyzing carbamoyl-phosphate synthase small subunit [Thermoplasmata archaeon]|nr:MAG: glutamine-hydrolyzing carbamoyl-phosphate synthase small subunit [Thermoplasmata archaeon]